MPDLYYPSLVKDQINAEKYPIQYHDRNVELS